MSKGYYKIPRDIHNSIKAKKNSKGYGLELAVLCLLGERVRYNGNYCEDLKIGQCRVGRDELAMAIGTTPQRIRTVLKTLEQLTIIQPATNQQGTLITVLRSDIYSMVQPTTNQQLTNNQPLTENKSKNKEKKEATLPPPRFLVYSSLYKARNGRNPTWNDAAAKQLKKLDHLSDSEFELAARCFFGDNREYYRKQGYQLHCLVKDIDQHLIAEVDPMDEIRKEAKAHWEKAV
jgi:predicted transcriptional regulator